MRDNRLAATLLEQGRDIVLLPLYTPLRTDERDVSRHTVHYGGINVYLEDRFNWFRRLPRTLTQFLDAPALLNLVGRFAAKTQPKDVADLTVSVLRGAHGPQRDELARLIDTLRIIKPSLVNLPNLMFAGVAKPLKDALGVPVVCTLTGEDIFLDQLPEPQHTEALSLIRTAAHNIDAFVSVTDYFAKFAAEHFGLPSDRIHIVPLGVAVSDFPEPVRTAPNAAAHDVFTIGYLARVCPEKGLVNLVDAVIELIESGKNCRLLVAGYLSGADKPYLATIESHVAKAGIKTAFEYLGAVDRDEKLRMLRSLDVLSVPTEYHEAKGVYILEALASGVPVVQPRHGSFPELITQTNGGILYDPSEKGALAQALAGLMDDPERRHGLGIRGRQVVHERFTDKLMAERTWALYTRLCAQHETNANSHAPQP